MAYDPHEQIQGVGKTLEAAIRNAFSKRKPAKAMIYPFGIGAEIDQKGDIVNYRVSSSDIAAVPPPRQ